ncbi:MAG: hypothetical protein ACD_52C00244G0001 [uncultured bacterium]|nr:MAG: hypothetical protein ACD_52C00244G0001 [uncultured bacterium]
MVDLYLTNSLTGKKEKFVPISSVRVGLYTCGPTVYGYPTIGNWRTYTLSDVVFRALTYFGYNPKFYMNLTDVGHLTGDNLGDADTGEDRIEKAAKKENKTAWDIAEFYIADFKASFGKLGFIRPAKFTRATEYITEQIELVSRIESKGFAYKIADGLYFDVTSFEKAGNKYGELSNLREIKAGARVEPNPDKKDPRDFALWKFSPKGAKRQMEWTSPWGLGFPGWHIECSAMSMKYLGDQFDIHVGGVDLKSTHHPNEIAQSEAATGKHPFVKYWVHGAFLTVDGKRMGKSEGNAYTLHDIEKRKIDPLALRYFYYTSHYRSQINFTWGALQAAQQALAKLRELVTSFRENLERTQLSPEKADKVDFYRERFVKAIGDDLNMPQALAVMWEAVKSNIPGYDKYDLLVTFDEVLGLDLSKASKLQMSKTPVAIQDLVNQREELRLIGQWQEADEIRKKINNLGFAVEDTPDGQKIKKL